MARRPAASSVFHAECPSRENLCLLTNKWCLLVLRALRDRTLRFGDLQRQIDGISQKMLAQTLRQLEAKGLVQRQVFADIPVRIEYSLTSRARPLAAPIEEICRWAESEGRAGSSAKLRSMASRVK